MPRISYQQHMLFLDFRVVAGLQARINARAGSRAAAAAAAVAGDQDLSMLLQRSSKKIRRLLAHHGGEMPCSGFSDGVTLVLHFRRLSIGRYSAATKLVRVLSVGGWRLMW